jgi:hypothetical protein
MSVVTGCGGSEPQSPTASPPPQDVVPQDATVTANIRTVDLEGRPLANMMPIATRHPNAFDPPVARGSLTKEDGTGSLDIPAAEHLYIRAWDPGLKMFANNYYEVLPGTEMDPAPLDVMMVSGTRLTAQLLTPDAKLAESVTVDLKMSHPTEGPWWPARADTNALGIVQFPSVPAGRYNIRIETVNGAKIDLTDVELPPGGSTDLGPVTLH